MKRVDFTSLNRFLFVVCIIFFHANSISSQTLRDSVINYFRLVQSVPQEKLYLHLDKPFYGAGENIWFQGYLQNAITHRDDAQSNYFIAELINRKDSVVQRKKIRRDSIGFPGSFVLPGNLSEGDYYLRGYSNWMLNTGEDFFYSRNIRIGNSIDISIVSSIEYQQEDDTGFIGKIKIIAQDNKPFVKTKIKYQLYEGEKLWKKGHMETDDNGVIRVPLPNLKDNNNKRVLDIAFDDIQYEYNKTFYLPNLSTEFDVTFFPEGGDLLAGVNQIVAFKALGANGLSKDVNGVLMNNAGDTLSMFRSEHAGMGTMVFSPENGQKYYAEITSAEGYKKRFDLPDVKKEGFSISLTQFRKQLRYQIGKSENTVWPDELYLAIHTRGNLRLFKALDLQSLNGVLDSGYFSEGVTHFLLIDGDGIPLSERLCFIRHSERPSWTVVTDKEKYGRRDKINMEITAMDNNAIPLNGKYSVSITDAGSVKPDSLSDNILSNLLLTSDLKGNIENPGNYFLDTNRQRDRQLDLIMLTNGWRRFHITNLKEMPDVSTEYFIEKGQYIEGRIKGTFGNKIKKGPITAFTLKGLVYQETETNEQGEFVLEDFNVSDTTEVVIQARTKKGFANVSIEVNEPIYPTAFNKSAYNGEHTHFMDDYLINAREKYYHEGGMQVINLKDIVVKADRIIPKSSNPIVDNLSTNTITSQDIMENMLGLDIWGILSQQPGITVDGESISIRGSSGTPVIMVDEFIYDLEILKTFSVNDIKRLDILKGVNAITMFGNEGASGAIVFELKRGADRVKEKRAKGMLTFSMLGYAKYTEFYHPKYDTPAEKKNQQADLRTTLYWNPLLIFNEEGKATIEYYNSDNSTSHQIEIEGVDEKGNVHRYSGRVL